MVLVTAFRCQIIGMFFWVSHWRNTLTDELRTLKKEPEKSNGR